MSENAKTEATEREEESQERAEESGEQKAKKKKKKLSLDIEEVDSSEVLERKISAC